MAEWVAKAKTPILETGNSVQALHNSMNQYSKTRSRVSGFTLLELMVVVLIIALVMTTVVLNVRIGIGEPPIKRSSDRLRVAMQMLSEESVLLNTSLGLKFYAFGYDVYRLKYIELTTDNEEYEYAEDGSLVKAPSPKDWRWIKVRTKEKDSPMRSYQLPDGLSFDVSLEGVSIVLDEFDADEEKEREKSNLKKEGTPIKPSLFITPDSEILPDFSIKILDDQNQNVWRSIEMNEDGELIVVRSPEKAN